MAPTTKYPPPLAEPEHRRQRLKVGAVCGKAARPDLCGGREVTRVSTATRHLPERQQRDARYPQWRAHQGRRVRAAQRRGERRTYDKTVLFLVAEGACRHQRADRHTGRSFDRRTPAAQGGEGER